jgi:membrane fusion protein (multidrug efflux system)
MKSLKKAVHLRALTLQSIPGLALSVALLSVSVAVSGCGVGEAKVDDRTAGEASTPLPVETASTYRSDIYATYETTGAIVADAEATVPARVGGVVIEVLAEEGDSVAEGEILARLDGERLRIEVRQAKARLEMATREYARMGQLQKRGLVSTAAVEGLKYELDALKASYNLLRLEYGYTEIRAPIAGIVSSRDIKLGTHVNPGTLMFSLTDTARLVAYLLIPQSELSRIASGHEARVHVDALPGQEFRATIARISPTVDMQNGTFRATAYIDNEDGRLAPGMFSRFSIAWEKHSDALLVPKVAIVREDNDSVVYVVRDGTASRRAVILGIEANDHVQILDGLDGSEQIVVTGQGSLRDGISVLASGTSADNTAG